MSAQRVAVTGATGFVGWHVCHELRKQNIEPIAIVRASSAISRLQDDRFAIRAADLNDTATLASAFANCVAVLHLAGAVDFGHDWARFHHVNVQGTKNVMSAARLAGVRRVVHCSTIAAVGAARTPCRLDESAKWNLGHLHVPYVTTKRDAELLALAANDARLEVVVVNPGSIIGPNDFAASEFGLLCRRFWRGRLAFHFGGGNSFVDVRDAAAGICAAWQRGQPGQRYILGGTNRTMSAFFAELAHASPEPIPRLRLPSVIGPAIAMLERKLTRKERPRAYLTNAQARLLPWFFYFDSGKAKRELGFTSRPLHVTVADAFDFWERRRAA
jgi:dihydroflavonol-4-reductase